MQDPTVNALTGKPCKGKEAARVLAMILLSPGVLTDESACEAAIEALRPFGWPNLPALCAKLGIPETLTVGAADDAHYQRTTAQL